MGLRLDDIVPWGRSLDEYVRMFRLTDADLRRSIADCASGPASFNAAMTVQGYSVTSYDPIYQFSVEAIAHRIQATKDLILAGVTEYQEAYRWQTIHSPQHLCELRLNTMNQFLADFPQGLAANRYQVATLPTLPVADQTFELALCSHLLFTYSNVLSLEEHWQAIQELCRVAAEVRIFPLVTTAGERSPHLDAILQRIRDQGTHTAMVETVEYEFQIGGNQQLRLVRS